MSKKVRLARIIGRAGGLAYDLSQLQFLDFRVPVGWQPDITAYRYEDHFEVWVDLAGVEKRDLHIEATPHLIRISGERRSPLQISERQGNNCQVMTMEIECGYFFREIELPAEILPDRVAAKQENGLLRIILPLA